MKQLEAIRGTMVHFGRVGAYEIEGNYFFPVPVDGKRLWSELNLKPNEIQEITKQMEKDLKELELILDAVDEYVASVFRSALSAKGVSIHYG